MTISNRHIQLYTNVNVAVQAINVFNKCKILCNVMSKEGRVNKKVIREATLQSPDKNSMVYVPSSNVEFQ